MGNFIVVDTEGKQVLREIAVIDHQGKLIYEAFAQEHPDNYDVKLNVKPLKQILTDFFKIAKSQVVIFHNASHDITVLRNSFSQLKLKWINLKSDCSLQLAQTYFSDLPSYSLEYLSQKLRLKVNNQYFNEKQAHSARYDAQFTYQLYRQILEKQTAMNTLSYTINPFGSNRVDNPFQDHVDLSSIYQDEYRILESIIEDVKYDKNHQSKGAIIIGEPGSGKTHLIMRLAKNRLKFNRLLFIRCPNNSESVLYHIYSRILESFVHEVPGTEYSQIEHLLAHSFVKLISHTPFMNINQKDLSINEYVKENPLDLYKQLGEEDTNKKIAYWQHIERRTNEWWFNQYGIAGYSPKIIKGIVKFCSYQERKRKELVTRWLAAESLSEEDLKLIGLEDWTQEMSKEAFSLEAIEVFSKLSLLNAPLIIVFDQLESLGLRHNRDILLNFGEAVKEIFTKVPNSLIILNLFPDRWQQFQDIFDDSIIDRLSQNQVQLKRPTEKELKGILELKSQEEGVDLNDLFKPEQLQDIINQNSIRRMLNRASDYYRSKVNNIPLLTEKVLDIENKTYQSFSLETRVMRIENQLSEVKNLFQQLGEVFDKSFSSNLKTENNVSKSDQNNIIDHKKNDNKTSRDSIDTVSKHDIISQEPQPDIPQEPQPDIPQGTQPPKPSIKDKLQEFLGENRNILEQEYQKLQIITESDDIGKLICILEAFKPVQNFEIDHLLLGKKKVPDHCLINKGFQKVVIGFLHSDSGSFTARIKNFNELVVTNKNIQFQVWRDAQKPPITAKGGTTQIEMLNNSANGKFYIMEKEERIQFELIYKLITDIQNRDLDVELPEALKFLLTEMQDCWLIKALV